MATYSPQKYIPFKKRIRNAFIGALAAVCFLTFHILTENHSTKQPDTLSQSEQTLLIIVFIIIPLLFVIGLIVYTQVWVLDKIVIDPKRKKIRVIIRKFDTVVDKGEYDIDDNLKVKINIKTGHKKEPITAMRIKYGKKIIFTQSNSDFAGAPNWAGSSFTNIRDEAENIKQFNFSSLHYKG
jgi:heme/copper-type cytochrome/quinol oxidase subunit 2